MGVIKYSASRSWLGEEVETLLAFKFFNMSNAFFGKLKK